LKGRALLFMKNHEIHPGSKSVTGLGCKEELSDETKKF
jgi:hypothetical protein